MSTQNQKKIANALREAADKIDPPVNQVRPPTVQGADTGPKRNFQTLDAEMHTERKGPMLQSLNSHTTQKEAQDALEE